MGAAASVTSAATKEECKKFLADAGGTWDESYDELYEHLKLGDGSGVPPEALANVARYDFRRSSWDELLGGADATEDDVAGMLTRVAEVVAAWGENGENSW